jgi:nitrogen fixation protein FixH
MAASTSTETWKYFPRYMIACMLVVIAVNVRFIYIAVSTFPGAASTDDFDTSNRYDAILNAVAQQDKLGWTETVSAQGMAPVVDLTGPDQNPLTGATLTSSAERPLGTDPAIAVTFTEAAPGHYVAASALPMHGQWDLKLNIVQAGHSAHVTRRVVIK